MAVQLEYLHSLKRLEVIMAGAPIARWAAFAGSGVSSKATHVLCEYLRAVHDINLKVSTDVFAESDAENRTFLMERFPEVPCLLDNVSQMSQSAGRNLCDGNESHLFGRCVYLDGGVPCQSRTPLSSKASLQIDCVQNRTGETGDNYELFRRAGAAHAPLLMTAERVVGLQQRSAPNRRHDAEYIVQTWKDKG